MQADSLQATVDQSKVRTIPLIPERGRIFDATGRILADNDRLLVATVDWEVMRRDTDRAELFSRLSGWLEMPVAEMEERYDSELYSRYRPMPLKEDVARTWPSPSASGPRTSPASRWRRSGSGRIPTLRWPAT